MYVYVCVNQVSAYVNIGIYLCIDSYIDADIGIHMWMYTYSDAEIQRDNISPSLISLSL